MSRLPRRFSPSGCVARPIAVDRLATELRKRQPNPDALVELMARAKSAAGSESVLKTMLDDDLWNHLQYHLPAYVRYAETE